jgi:glycosyltransferase involved in cell wall biosynthesis
MTIDALAFEPQFLAHLDPVWRALPDHVRGTFFVEGVNRSLAEDAARRGVAVALVDGMSIRMRSSPPLANPGDGPTALVASIGDTKIGRRLGYRRFVFLEHGAGQSYSGTGQSPIEASYAGGPDREDVGLFLVPNEHAAARWRSSYAAPVEVVGCPKLEDLPAREPGELTIAISFHWPTPHSLPAEAGNALADFMPILGELATRYRVIGHAHPKGDWPEMMARIYRRAGIDFVRSFDDVCRQADVYVCDNSSTIFEFAATGRPVVLMNSRYYRKTASHGLRFWDAAHVGLQVDPTVRQGTVDAPKTLAAMDDAIARSLDDPPELRTQREAALDIVYQPRAGGAERAAAAITEWLGTQAAVAA